MPKPIYNAETIRVIHNLRYDWTGWLANRGSAFPKSLKNAIETCRVQWHDEGLALDAWKTKWLL